MIILTLALLRVFHLIMIYAEQVISESEPDIRCNSPLVQHHPLIIIVHFPISGTITFVHPCPLISTNAISLNLMWIIVSMKGRITKVLSGEKDFCKMPVQI